MTSQSRSFRHALLGDGVRRSSFYVCVYDVCLLCRGVYRYRRVEFVVDGVGPSYSL